MIDRALTTLLTLFVILFGAAFFLYGQRAPLEHLCLNLLLVEEMKRGGSAESSNLLSHLCARRAVNANGRLAWLQGYNQWQQKAVNAAHQQWAAAPDYAAVMLNHQVEIANPQPASALLMLDHALQLFPQEEIGRRTTDNLFHADSWPEIHQIFNKASQENPLNPLILSSLALTTQTVTKEEEKALALYEAAWQLDRSNPAVLSNGLRLLIIHPNFGQQRAEQLTAAAVQELPQGFEFTLNLASAFRYLDNYERASYYNQQALQIDPNHAPANLFQAELSFLLQQEEEAVVWTNRAFDQRISNASYRQRLLALLEKSQQEQNAAIVFCEGVELGISRRVLTASLTTPWQQRLTAEMCEN